MAPAIDSRPSSGPSSSSAVEPGGLAGRLQEVVPLAASRAAEVATRRPRTTPSRSMSGPVVPQHGQATPDGLGRELTGGIDPLAEARDPHQSLEWAAHPIGHQQPGGVGAAIDRRHRSDREHAPCYHGGVRS